MKKTKKMVSFTKYTSSFYPLSKKYKLTNNGIEKSASATMHKGIAERVIMPFEDFGKALSMATSNQAFGYGLHFKKYPDKVNIVIDGKEKPEDDILSRTKKFFKYRHQPGILMLDYDPSEYELTPQLTAKELIKILVTIDPNIATSAMFIRGSISASVHLTGKRPGKGKGFHIYIPVEDTSGIPQYGKLLFDYLWLHGHGYIALGSNGHMHVRSLIDAAVFSGERIDFVGRPMIQDEGLEYTEPPATYALGTYLDISNLPELTVEKANKVAVLIKEAKKAIKPASDRKRVECIKDKVNKIVQKTGMSREKAIEHVDKVFAGKCKKLWGEWILEFPEGDVTVAEVLDDPEAYDNRTLADPIEGREYGNTTAKFWWNDGKPIIHSFAHGEDISYFLYVDEPKRCIEGVEPYHDHPDYISKEEACALMEQAVEKWIKKPQGNFAIVAPAGIGKTEIILKHVANEATKKLIEIYVPTHRLAKEVSEKLLRFNPNLSVQVIRGRTYVDENIVGDVALCEKAPLIKSIQSYGYNIVKDVCLECEFFDSCNYFEQFNDSKQVRIYTHKHLQLRGMCQ